MEKARNRNRIHEIADELAEVGAQVTASAVRQAMDNREPYSKIARELDDWRKAHPPAPPKADAPVLEDVEKTLSSVLHVIWHAGAIEARSELQRIRHEAQQETAALKTQLADSVQEIVTLENDNNFHLRKLEELSEALQKSEATLSQHETEATSLRQHTADLSQQHRALVEKVERLSARAAAAETELRLNRSHAVTTRERFDENLPPPEH